eukprot:Gb_22121 [translate_table: standard]
MENKELAEWDESRKLWVSEDESPKLDPLDEEEKLDREFNEQLDKEENSFICDDEGYNSDDDDEDYYSHDEEREDPPDKRASPINKIKDKATLEGPQQPSNQIPSQSKNNEWHHNRMGNVRIDSQTPYNEEIPRRNGRSHRTREKTEGIGHSQSAILGGSLPQVVDEGCLVDGYFIPKDNKIMVNVWGIDRDPNLWEKPLEFNPERFLMPKGYKIYPRGNDFVLIPLRHIWAGTRTELWKALGMAWHDGLWHNRQMHITTTKPSRPSDSWHLDKCDGRVITEYNKLPFYLFIFVKG